jgi:O-antigen/teichoic acid export membrane protein
MNSMPERSSSEGSLGRQAANGVKWNGVATATKIIVQFLSMAVLARLLAPGDFGLMSMALVVTGIVQAFSDLGLSNVIIHRQDASREQLSSIYWLNLGFGLALFILLWLAAPLAADFFRKQALPPLLRWTATAFLITPLGHQWQALLRRDMEFKVVARIEIAETLAYAATTIGLAMAGHGVMSLVWGALARTALRTLLLAAAAARRGWLPAFHFRPSDLKGFAGFGLFQMGERALNYLATNVDYLIIGRLLGAAALGYYTLAYNLMRMPLTYINPTIVSVAFPAFARVQGQDDVLRRGYARILRYLSGLSFPVMAGMLVVAPLFVPLYYGERWTPVVPLIQIFCLLGASKSIGNPLGSLLLAKGRADLGFYLNLFALAGLAASNLAGARWGVIGVAASTVLFSLVCLKPLDFYLRWRMIRMTVRGFWSAIRYPSYASLAMIALLLLARSIIPAGCGAVPALAALILLGMIIYGTVLWLLDRSFFLEALAVLGLARPKGD